MMVEGTVTIENEADSRDDHPRITLCGIWVRWW
jgi:hypothetical protein